MRTFARLCFLLALVAFFAASCSHSSVPAGGDIKINTTDDSTGGDAGDNTGGGSEGGDNDGTSGALTKDPDIFDNFTSQGTWVLREIFPKCAGTISFGVDNSNAGDGKVVRLARTPNSKLGPDDCLDPKYSMEIRTKDEMSYGRYEVRAKAAGCGVNNKEIVTGIFTYWNDGKDLNGNGMIDNSEIDIEILCNDPTILSLTIWTDYTSTEKNRHVTREIWMTTGEYYQTEPGKESSFGVSSKSGGKIEGLPIKDFDPTARFYDLGFEWSASRIRYFIVHEGKEITLWDFTDKIGIPTHSARFMLNVWRDNAIWSPGTGTPSKADATLEVDWFKYWKE